MKQKVKPFLAVLVLALLGGLAWHFLRPRENEERWLGYVEAETLYIAAPQSGRLASRPVDRGARVSAGSSLFSLETVTADAETERTEAEVLRAQAQAADLTTTRQRQAEIDVSRATARAAAAQLVKTEKDLQRQSALLRRGFTTRAQVDSARAARDSAQAALDQAQAQIRSGEISAGRAAQIAAARAGVVGAEATLKGQRQRRADIAPVSPANGVIEQTYFNPGEWVPANAPVVSIVPDDRRKLRFYVPQAKVAALRVGTGISFTCDGCGAERQARISFIAPRAEFSPPVIYSERARAKLVFLVEAMLPASGTPLPLGLPVEVTPP